jgi:hypothetical protein
MNGFDLMGVDDQADFVGAAFLRQPPPMSTFIPDMRAVQGVPYDGSRGKPNGFVGSYGLFTGATNRSRGGVENLTQTDNLLMTLNPVYAFSADSALGDEHYGFVWGSFDKEAVPGGIPYGGRLQENKWNEIFGRYEPGASGDFNRVATPAEAFASATRMSKHDKPFGPLVGNPMMLEFSKLRVDAQGNMFWHPLEVPKWAKRGARVVRRPTKTIDQQRVESRRTWEAEQAKLKTQRAAAQAAQDAANAMAERAATDNAMSARQALAHGEAENGFDVLGAEDALANQYIIVRVKRIDQAKLAGKIGGSQGQLASSALTIVNTMPRAALDAALPIAKTKALEYGIDADVTVSDVPPSLRARAFSEFWPGLGIGVVLGGFSLGIIKLLGKLVSPRAGQ